MGGISVHVFTLTAVVIGFAASLASAQCNTTSVSESQQCSFEDGFFHSNLTFGNTSVETCNTRILKYASSWISTALDNLTIHLVCQALNNEIFTEEKLQMLLSDLRQIMESTLNLYYILSNNQSQSDVIDVLGVLNTLTADNLHNVDFIKLWFYIKIKPLLAFVSKEFMLNLSGKNWSCATYQTIVKGFSDEFPNMEKMKQKMVYDHFISVFLTRNDTSDPGCVSDTKGTVDWLKLNYGEYSAYAALEDFLKINRNFSALDVLDSLSPDQKAQLILDPSTGTLENETIVKLVFSSLLESPEEGQLDAFFVAFVHATTEKNVTIIRNQAVRDIMLNLTLTALAPRFPIFEPDDFALWFQTNLVVLLASFTPDSLVVIPRNISCDSYRAILKGLEESLASLQPAETQGIESSKEVLMEGAPKSCKLDSNQDGNHQKLQL
ncbi:hypothetical protein MATL_G00009920 [Megalops atlanticus]|uniref:Uncharacterized protein n=1 Tax=Megalops atlanticus TaxID=7932 RepID=A0A9D3QL61_MEGAT|nr:hypothetical protein MATL_G00009920 [Megalops atlanticus]